MRARPDGVEPGVEPFDLWTCDSSGLEKGCTGDPGGSERKWISAVLPNEADGRRGCLLHFLNMDLVANR